jgi:ring-1,2-phenylacetyl-CoA epoxidase subunit PaaE
MAANFYPIHIKNIQQETKDCVSVVLNIPESLQNTFQFIQGQYLTFRATINGKEVRRNYSLCSSPLQNEWRIAIKKVQGGLFSTFANEQLKVGDIVDVMPPSGKFFSPLNISNQKNYLAIAAGSGITPILSIIQTTLALETDSTFTLIFGNRTRQHIIFKEQLEALKNKYLQRFQLVHILSKERTDASINQGRIDTNKLIELSKLINYKTIDDCFICGPEEMMLNAKSFLQQQNISTKIHIELFETKNRQRPNINRELDEINNLPKSNITVKLDGRSFDFKLSFNSESILDAAMQQAADLPYACKGGVCCTCKAKLISGEVKMNVCYGLEQEEIEQGFVLTCQAHPLTENVMIDFDAK